ncbi:aminoacyl-tRNA deacylase [Reinekea thalattae]|uniref:YbaK/aminoacyl-tRNA synthetase-associated domain-containing protein n=1 Tax=Reinekea thalattae TaxID=2593301 RepID=A0A5C8Z5D0_9GAMM|nr:YbaK/EbsC family protein [Reinekea thalattae]TXR53172.1 hypothetical protein FME95_00945 [Reinekea thalattae]
MSEPLPTTAQSDLVFQRIKQQLQAEQVEHEYLAHETSKTIQDAQDKLQFDVNSILKTIVFKQKNAGLILVGLTGHKRIDYKKLGQAVGVSRSKLSTLSPEEVLQELQVEVGGVSPFLTNADIALWLDVDFPDYVICGSGRFDYSIRINSQELIRSTNAQLADLTKVEA